MENYKFFELLKCGQLILERDNGFIDDLKEGLILFPPTYKLAQCENK